MRPYRSSLSDTQLFRANSCHFVDRIFESSKTIHEFTPNNTKYLERFLRPLPYTVRSNMFRAASCNFVDRVFVYVSIHEIT